jgi:hypothetical protein
LALEPNTATKIVSRVKDELYELRVLSHQELTEDTEPVVDGMPRLRESAIDRDYPKNIGTLPILLFPPVDKILTVADGQGFREMQVKAPPPALPKPSPKESLMISLAKVI